MTRLYTAEATAYGPRTGAVVSSDERLDLELSRPKDMGGDDGPGTNPEQLFAAGYAACFHSALKLGARHHKLDAAGSSVTARVGLGPNDAGGFELAVELDVAIPKADRHQAEQVMKQAHEVCPYSNATRGNIDVTLKLV